MSNHIKNSPCPKCRENGHDRQGDNLALYSDGSCYCWACHYYIPSDNIIGKFKSKHNKPLEPISRIIQLPSDSTIDYPQKALTWINQYGLSKADLLLNGVVYSDRYERLIFPLWDNDSLLGWQGRYFGNDPEKIKRNKWFGQGQLQDICYIFYLGKGGSVTPMSRETRLVVVEDIISAIKVSKASNKILAMPIFGANIKTRWKQIRVLSPIETILWLDPDMYIKMVKECNTARLNGFKCHPVLSKHDPKQHSYDEIKELLI